MALRSSLMLGYKNMETSRGNYITSNTTQKKKKTIDVDNISHNDLEAKIIFTLSLREIVILPCMSCRKFA